MITRVGLYIRVSSERQRRVKNKETGECEEKISPIAQERTCRKYCEAKGYHIGDVYRDIEKYRVGKRLVEPSATRADRPQLKRMLADADAGKLDLIVGWREDRLYRAYRPMLEVLECLERNRITIELTNDSFDPRFAPIKAWAAKMELEAKHERFIMGVGGRLASGKVWNHPPSYGWKRVEGRLEIEPEEAKIVNHIWALFAEGETAREIRRRLVAMGAKERREGNKTPWATSYIYKILHNATYHTGILKTTWGEETFEIKVPAIITPDLAERVKAKLERKREYPARNMVYNYLGAGLVYCAACNVRMTARTVNRRERKNGIRSEYFCFRCNMGLKEPDCAKTISANILDPLIWAKLWDLMTTSGKFEAMLEARIAALKAQEIDAEGECGKLTSRLDDLMMERQKVITGWRKGKMTDDDYDMQLGALTIEQAGLERERNNARLLIGNRAERLAEVAQLWRENALTGAHGLNDTPQTPEQAQRQFELRRKFVEGLVKRIDLRPNHEITLHIEINFAELVPAVESAELAPIVQNSVSAGSYRYTDLYRVSLTV